jgi:hypothetical protein
LALLDKITCRNTFNKLIDFSMDLEIEVDTLLQSFSPTKESYDNRR